MRIFAYGGGVQSTAALVLAVQGRIGYQSFYFCNVGDDSEHPDTLRYVRDVAMPYAAHHGIELVELRRIMRSGEERTLLSEALSDTRSMPIPLRIANGRPGRRSCTLHYKIRVMARETKRRGATPDKPALIGLGISTDEYQRMNSQSTISWHQNDYPLIDLQLSRSDCHRIIADAGLPSPGKSSCWFCPFLSRSVWQRRQQHEPELFERAVQLERTLSEKSQRLGHPELFITKYGVPLDQVFGGQLLLNLDDSDDFCDSGHCMT